MPVTATHLTSGGTNLPATTNLTASITPSAGKLVLIAISQGDQSVTPTITGCGMNWVYVGRQTGGGTNWAATLFRGLSLNPPSTGQLSINFSSASNINELRWSLNEFGNVEQSGLDGANAIVQVAGAVGGPGATSGSVTLAAFGSADNATFGTLSLNGPSTVTPGTDFTELSEVSLSTRAHETQWKNSNDTGVDWTWSSGQNYGALAVEIKYSPVDLVTLSQSAPMNFGGGITIG